MHLKAECSNCEFYERFGIFGLRGFCCNKNSRWYGLLRDKGTRAPKYCYIIRKDKEK